MACLNPQSPNHRWPKRFDMKAVRREGGSCIWYCNDCPAIKIVFNTGDADKITEVVAEPQGQRPEDFGSRASVV